MAPDPRESLEAFLKTIWKPPPGREEDYWVYTPTMRRTDGEWKKTFFHLPEHWDYLLRHILGASGQHKDVYISPALWAKASITRQDVLGSWCVWADFDGNAPSSWAETPNDHASVDRAAAPGPPSVRVQSSTEGHEHVYWILDDFATNIEWLEHTNRSLAYTYDADASGWDYSQLLRPPATTNYGKTNKRLPVLLASLDSTQYAEDSFRNLPTPTQVMREEITEAEIIPIEQVLSNYTIDHDQADLLHKPLEGIEHATGGRSGAMMRLAFYSAEIGMTDVEIYSLLYFLDEKWGKFKERKDRSKRLLDMVNKAKLKYPDAIDDPQQEAFEDHGDIERDPRTVFGFKDLLHSQYKVTWMIDQLAAAKSIGLIASAPGKGKTQFMCGLAMHAATGREHFVGYKIATPHKILFFSLEMGPELLQQFMITMAPAYTEKEHDLLQDNFMLLPAGQQMSLMPHRNPKEVSAGRVFLESLIEDYRPNAIYIDSLARVLPGKFEDSDVIELFSYFSKLRSKFGVYIFIVHHNRKAQGDNKRPKNLEDIYGSQYIGGEVDWAITLYPELPDNSVLEVNEVKNRLAPVRKPFHIRRLENLQFTVTEFSGAMKGGITLNGLREGAAIAPPSEQQTLHSLE